MALVNSVFKYKGVAHLLEVFLLAMIVFAVLFLISYYAPSVEKAPLISPSPTLNGLAANYSFDDILNVVKSMGLDSYYISYIIKEQIDGYKNISSSGIYSLSIMFPDGQIVKVYPTISNTEELKKFGLGVSNDQGKISLYSSSPLYVHVIYNYDPYHALEYITRYSSSSTYFSYINSSYAYFIVGVYK